MEERELDFYVNTPDEYFNISTQKLYIKFKGSVKPQTDKPYEVFIHAIAEAYFFAINNPSKPFGFLARVKELAKLRGFNDADLLIFVDMLLSVISKKPDSEQYRMIIIQLVEFRHELSPFESAQEIRKVLNKDYYFDIDKIQETLKNTTDPSDKIVYLSNLVFDFNGRKFGMDEDELEYYESIGLTHFIVAEIERAKHEIKIGNNENSNKTNKQVIDFKLASDKKADFIRMISDMIDNEIFEPVNPAVLLTKEYVLKTFGTWLNEDLQAVVENKKPLIQTLTEKPSKNSIEEGKAFPDYLLHENKIKLAEAIKKEFSTEKGKFIRILLEAMEVYDPPLISIGSRQGKELYDSLKLFFNRNIGRYQSVFGYTINEDKDQADIDRVTIRLNHLLRIVEKDKTA